MAESKLLAQIIANARLLASGIRKNDEGLAKRGMSQEFIDPSCYKTLCN